MFYQLRVEIPCRGVGGRGGVKFRSNIPVQTYSYLSATQNVLGALYTSPALLSSLLLCFLYVFLHSYMFVSISLYWCYACLFPTLTSLCPFASSLNDSEDRWHSILHSWPSGFQGPRGTQNKSKHTARISARLHIDLLDAAGMCSESESTTVRHPSGN